MAATSLLPALALLLLAAPVQRTCACVSDSQCDGGYFCVYGACHATPGKLCAVNVPDGSNLLLDFEQDTFPATFTTENVIKCRACDSPGRCTDDSDNTICDFLPRGSSQCPAGTNDCADSIFGQWDYWRYYLKQSTADGATHWELGRVVVVSGSDSGTPVPLAYHPEVTSNTPPQRGWISAALAVVVSTMSIASGTKCSMNSARCDTCPAGAITPCTANTSRTCAAETSATLVAAVQSSLPVAAGLSHVSTGSVLLSSGAANNSVVTFETLSGIKLAGVDVPATLRLINKHTAEAVTFFEATAFPPALQTDPRVLGTLAGHRAVIDAAMQAIQDVNLVCRVKMASSTWLGEVTSLRANVSALAATVAAGLGSLRAVEVPAIGAEGSTWVVQANDTVFVASDLYFQGGSVHSSTMPTVFLADDGGLVVRAPQIDVRSSVYLATPDGAVVSVGDNILDAVVGLQELVAQLVDTKCLE